MATILLSAAGAAFGGSIGGSFLGLSMVAWGRFAGATLGRAIDQSLMGQGSESIETGRVERFHLSNSGEGRAIAQVYGRVRVGGQVIWTTHFKESTTTEGGDDGGKGAPASPEITTYHYSVNMALALCEGEIAGVSRVWADGVEISANDINMRVYPGSRDQLPDPKMEAVEGEGQVPAYRGTAYVVLEDFKLADYGNRVPQLSFEVLRVNQAADDMPELLQGVAMLPGTGEYTLATSKQYYGGGGGSSSAAINVNTASEVPDFIQSLGALEDQAPNCNAVSLVVSWFGNDLRCAECSVRPKVEQKTDEAGGMPWKVAGLNRSSALQVPRIDDKPVYGGTPADRSVIEAITRMREDGKAVMFYPFILMEQLENNQLPDPYGRDAQPPLPWRGRITLAQAPGQDGSSDRTSAAQAEVAAFVGTAKASDFQISGQSVSYSGPEEWSFSRFILHYAALTKAAGGVDAFCIGSELRGLTQIRDDQGFPFVAALRMLVGEVRSILGPDVKLSYAADWSEYFGYRPNDGSGDVYFHLDPLWADPEIDFIGIDNYMPLSDWRDGRDHADADYGRIHNLDYLDANVEGGEGFDWYYSSPEAIAAQRRTPIVDTGYGEDWVFRYKDLRGWWENSHHNRIGGVRQIAPTEWIAQSKPFWFTELGCPAVDKGTNQPNVFLDPKSSESALPRGSNGQPDEDIQRQYLRATHLHWSDPVNNPVSGVYEAPMIDMSRAFVWAWDARPYPWFPALTELWADGDNYRRGHWITGRLSTQRLATVVAAICDRVGLTDYDVSDLVGMVRGYLVPDIADGRRALQPLMLSYGFDAIERDGVLVFRMREGRDVVPVDPELLAEHDDVEGALIQTRANEVDLSGRVRLHFYEAEGDHDTVAEEAVLPDDRTHAVADSEVALTLTRAEGRQIAERWLSEARIARDTLKFALPPSALQVRAGDVVALPGKGGPVHARIDRVEVTDRQLIEAVRMEDDIYIPAATSDVPGQLTRYVPAAPVTPLFLDLPLLTGDEVPHAPHFAAYATPWPGSVAVYSAPSDADYSLNSVITGHSVVGETESALFAAPSGRLHRAEPLRIRLYSGALQSVSDEALLGGANVLAIGDGGPGNWEVLQFRDAEMLTQQSWLVSTLLRGQAGTDGVMPDVWPAGSVVVRLNGTPEQIEMSASQRRQAIHFRIGPSSRSIDDPTYVHRTLAFDGVGLRPYSPVHLRGVEAAGSLQLSWVRRTRIDGDDWELAEPPLAEETEAYLVRVMRGATVLREATVASPAWTYAAQARATDLANGPVRIDVAQISARFGPGPAARLVVNA
ncbi:baseplate multidomain protein megatron [Roseivivax sp. CAU 1753]